MKELQAVLSFFKRTVFNATLRFLGFFIEIFLFEFRSQKILIGYLRPLSFAVTAPSCEETGTAVFKVSGHFFFVILARHSSFVQDKEEQQNDGVNVFGKKLEMEISEVSVLLL